MTTILCVRHQGTVAMGGDGQVSVGNTVMKHDARKVRPLAGGKVLTGFADRTDRVLRLVDAFMLECRWLDDAETLTYLHGCVSTKRHRVRVPETPMYLDALLADIDTPQPEPPAMWSMLRPPAVDGDADADADAS